MVSSTTGEVIVDTVIKSAFKHKAGGQYSEQEVNIMENTSGHTRYLGQVSLFEQVVELLRNKLVDLDNKKVYENLKLIKIYLGDIK